MAKPTDELKIYLRTAEHWKKRKKVLSERIKWLRSRAEKITTTYSDVPASGSFEDRRQSTIAEMVDTQRKYEEAVAECTSKLQEIESFIGRLKISEEKSVMEMRYLFFMDWPDVAVGLDYHLRTVHKIHSKALVHLLEIHQKMIEQGGRRLF